MINKFYDLIQTLLSDDTPQHFWVIGQKVCVTNPNKLENL